MSDATETAAARATGLRALADMIEAHPEIDSSVTTLYAWHPGTAEEMAAIARAGLKHGGKVDKDISDTLYNLEISFGPITATAIAWRNRVCERVVVGTETATEKVKDPDALAEVPEIEVTEERELVEWRCAPLLEAGVGS